MRRREFVTLVSSAAAWSFTARAQQAATKQRIAIFHPAIPTTLLTETGGGSAWRAFFAELRRLGYVEGENLIIERYSAEGRSAFLACLLVLNDLRHFGRVYAMAAAQRPGCSQGRGSAVAANIAKLPGYCGFRLAGIHKTCHLFELPWALPSPLIMEPDLVLNGRFEISPP
jgi:hypothetical protein